MEGEEGERRDVRRPMNAFLIFCKRHRSVVRQKNPDMDNRSVTRVLGDLWANLGEEKSTYTNLAKQYKDAFMKAHPNYKWHSSEKQQGTSAKLVAKPTNSRVIKNVAEISTDGGIIPGKLADPEKMGGLNLLLMADKETSHELRPSLFTPPNKSSSVPASTKKSEQAGTSNNALLQLAEMCASELQSSVSERPSSYPNTPLTQALSQHPLALSSSFPSHLSNQTPMAPPKKRARHWSLTESSEVHGYGSDHEGNCDRAVDLSPLNLTTHTPQYMSGESMAHCDESYSSVERYKGASSRRRLSSSATESIPSPSPPYVDDAESPVFTSEFSRSEKLAEPLPSFPGARVLSVNLPTDKSHLVTLESTQPNCSSVKPLTSVSEHIQSQQLNVTLAQALRAVPQFHLSAVSAGQASTPTTQQSKPVGGQQVLFSQNILAQPGDKMAKSNTFKIDVKMEKNPDFYQWREPGKTKPISSELSQNNKALISTNEAPSKLTHSFSYKEQPQNLALPCQIKLETENKPQSPSQTKMDLSSLLSAGRISSLLSNNDVSSPKLTLVSSSSSAPSVGLFQNFEGLSKLGVNLNTGTGCVYKEKESIIKVPSSNPANTFSEGKLKKKWAERMLVEAKLKEDLTQAQTAVAATLVDSRITTLNANQTNAGQGKAESQHFQLKIKPELPDTGYERNNLYTDLKATNDGDNKETLFNHPAEKAPRPTPTRSTSFSASSHPKLMLQLSQTQPLQQRASQIWSQTLVNPAKVAPDHQGTAPVAGDQKAFKLSPRPETTNCAAGFPKEESKPVLNSITACGQKIYDHIVEQLTKSDFSGDRAMAQNSAIRNAFLSDTHLKHIKAEAIKAEPKWQEDRKDFSPLLVTNLVEKVVREVCGSPPGKEGCTSCRKTEDCAVKNKNTVSNPNMKEGSMSRTSQESSANWDSYRQPVTNSPTYEGDGQGQWSSVAAESGDHSDNNDDTGAPPVRKSRRANRGQKYQELIKEGFIQPSRERLAARNAERNGRSFGTRDEFDKMDNRRTLKRSASERDTTSASVEFSSNGVGTTYSGSLVTGDSSVDKIKFRTGAFDLEKEIKSLPVCSMSQLEKRKAMKRRCDSELLGVPQRARSNSDPDCVVSPPAATVSCGAVKYEVSLESSGCPAPHIPIPKEERPSEPVTGSRKRKARNYCITRISIQGETDQNEENLQECVKKSKDSSDTHNEKSHAAPLVSNSENISSTMEQVACSFLSLSTPQLVKNLQKPLKSVEILLTSPQISGLVTSCPVSSSSKIQSLPSSIPSASPDQTSKQVCLNQSHSLRAGKELYSEDASVASGDRLPKLSCSSQHAGQAVKSHAPNFNQVVCGLSGRETNMKHNTYKTLQLLNKGDLPMDKKEAKKTRVTKPKLNKIPKKYSLHEMGVASKQCSKVTLVSTLPHSNNTRLRKKLNKHEQTEPYHRFLSADGKMICGDGAISSAPPSTGILVNCLTSKHCEDSSRLLRQIHSSSFSIINQAPEKGSEHGGSSSGMGSVSNLGPDINHRNLKSGPYNSVLPLLLVSACSTQVSETTAPKLPAISKPVCSVITSLKTESRLFSDLKQDSLPASILLSNCASAASADAPPPPAAAASIISTSSTYTPSLLSVTPVSSVISLATSTNSAMDDIVSYSVIGPSSVIEAGSPRMIGSPHLPESPSVAAVQS
ncbi:uncharacterized protein LOC131953655 [Physella acuta]|uniref:uncharacterized protein LOC131953655 n=1 Tax=Physella acuta TaxID=109671 RepID=UPI0027DC6377|nr:uncharacterized protein LOC131953655 [Physella acuta]XP_059172936.1 uncharacterized protein LOC131953655 [Physella acuta]